MSGGLRVVPANEAPWEDLAAAGVALLTETGANPGDAIYFAAGARKRSAAERKRIQELTELPQDDVERLIAALEEEMHEAAEELRFEYAARLRDEIKDLRRELTQVQ